ncbi:MAG: glycosyltransferase, partial [Muribaculaceae bacterium]|nr:glycosyltransferase [Muribaculaceae bacterium]
AVVVYPYISATQSGVASIASYFDKPLVVSDLPFFMETCEGCAGVEFFPNGDIEGLADAIKRSLDTPASTLDMYQRQYSPEVLRDALIDVIARLC